MKIQKVFVIVTALVTCAIAIPFVHPLPNNVLNFYSSGTMPSVVVFLSIFIFMACLGWVKRVNK